MDEAVVALTPDLINEIKAIFSDRPPYWFRKLKPSIQGWWRDNAQRIINGELGPMPATMGRNPLCANLRKNTYLHFNPQGEWKRSRIVSPWYGNTL